MSERRLILFSSTIAITIPVRIGNAMTLVMTMAMSMIRFFRGILRRAMSITLTARSNRMGRVG